MAGKGTGKLGSMVYATVRGAQIVRQYNPVVFNPNTEKQTVQRARFSLLTKTAAMVSPALLFMGKGPLVSNRNAFIKANFDKFSSNDVSLKFDELALNSSNVEASAYPTVSVNAQTRAMTISLSAATTLFAGFGYAVILIPDAEDGKVWVRSGIVPSEGATSASVSVTLPVSDNIANVAVIGYPMFYKDGATRVSYANQIEGFDSENAVKINIDYNRMVGQGDIIVYATRELEKTA